MKDMGRVMAEVKTRHATSIEPAKASALVKALLGAVSTPLPLAGGAGGGALTAAACLPKSTLLTRPTLQYLRNNADRGRARAVAPPQRHAPSMVINSRARCPIGPFICDFFAARRA